MMFPTTMRHSSHLLFLSVVVLLLGSGTNAEGLRKSVKRNLEDSQLCNIQWIDIQFDDGRAPVKELKCLVDKDWNGYNNGVDDFCYSITLPSTILEANDAAIRSGTFYVAIPNAEIIDDGSSVPYVTVPDPSAVAIVQGVRRERHLVDRELQTRYNSVLVVRVSTSSGDTCDPSANQLAGSVLGIGSQAIQHSMKSQYEACSYGQQSFTPVSGNGVVNGVVDVTIGDNIQGRDIFSLTNAMNRAARDVVGSSLSASPKHVMYCVPTGTTYNGSQNWVAFAYVNGVSSYYNNNWCDRLSSQMHEVGHNLGMQHSNENGEYGDQSGYMGFSYPERNGPLMCFNAFKHYKFGWYSSQTRTITGAWTGQLVAFTDAAGAPGSTVILKLGDVYMQFNRAEGMNSGTTEKKNEVVLVRASESGGTSEALAGLGSGESYSTGGFTVEVCSINYGSIDNAQVSIFTNGGRSGCSNRSVGNSSCQDDLSRYFVVSGHVRNCQWVAANGAGYLCNGSAKYWCKSTCGTCP